MILIILVSGILVFNRLHPVSEYYQKVEQDVQLNGTVCEIRTGSVGKTYVLSVEGETGMPDSFTCERVLMYSEEMEESISIQIGNLLSVYGKLRSFSLPGNPGQFNEFEYYMQKKIDYRIYAKKIKVLDETCSWFGQFLYECRERFNESIRSSLPERQAGIMVAMLTGEKAMLDEESKELYGQAGIAHILAISGLHVSILCGALFYFLRKYLCRMQVAGGVTLILLVLYGFFTGFGVATQRAVIMTACMLVAYMTGYSYDPPSAMCLAAIITLCRSPYALFQAGFLLSYGSVCGIYLVIPAVTKLFPLDWLKKRFGNFAEKLGASLAASLGMSISTLPLVLFFYYELPTYGILVNLIVLPSLSCLVGMGFLSGCVGMFWAFAGRFLSGIVSTLLFCMDQVCRFVAKLPSPEYINGRPELWQVIAYYAFLTAVCYLVMLEGRKSWLLYLAGVVLLFYHAKLPDFSFWMLDVGQGDGMYMQIEGSHFLIDGGSSSESGVGKRRIIPFLKSQGVSEIDAAFLTHSDADHTNGIMEMIENKMLYGIRIKTVVFPSLNKPDEAYQDLIQRCERAGVTIEYLQKGQELRFQNGTIQCLHPYPDYSYESVNDSSLVLRVQYRNGSILLTGDLEKQGEEQLMDLLGPVNLLKAGHHGSKNSTTEAFLAHTQPRIVLFSAGAGNRYGHPSSETLSRVREQGAFALSTIDTGAISLVSKKEEDGFFLSCFKMSCQGNEKQVK